MVLRICYIWKITKHYFLHILLKIMFQNTFVYGNPYTCIEANLWDSVCDVHKRMSHTYIKCFFLILLFLSLALHCHLIYQLQFWQLIPAPFERTSVIAWLCKHPGITCQQNMPRTLMAHVACRSKVCSVVRSSMPKILGGNQACGRLLCPGCPRI